MAELKYEIVQHLATIAEGSKGWSKELNLVSWNERDPKFDLREWSPDHTKMGKGITLRDGKDVAIVATGILVGEAIKAGELLAAEGIDARIINIHTIKPIDKELLVKASRETGRILTCEEHSIIGGLGSAVIEAIAEDAPCKVSRLGVNDQYGHSGPGAKLLEEYGFTAENIAARAKELLK